MSRQFTALTVVFSASVAFLVGLIIAGEFTHSPVVSSAPRVAPSAVARPARVSGGPSVVNFADVAELINAAVVNIDATSKTPRELSRRRPGDVESGSARWQCESAGSHTRLTIFGGDLEDAG